MRGEFIDIGGSRLYYYAAGTRGAGDPLILLHGMPSSGHVWSELVPLLPAGHRIVVLDLLGFGRSDVPMGRSLSLTAHAERLIAFMDVLGIRSAALAGHHFGGAVAQATAIKWPDRVTRLALIDSIGFDVVMTGTLALLRAFLPLSRALPSRAILRAATSDLSHRYVDPARGRRSIEQFLRPFRTREGTRVLMKHLASLDESETESLGQSISQLTIPVSLIWGSDDAFAPRSIAVRLRKALPSATLDIIDHLRHFTPEEAPERVATILSGLLRR